jgi:drug/metabolite transporter (DMT)-like permease
MEDEPGQPVPVRFRKARRVARIVLGFTTILIGLILAIPGIPGPGLLIVIGGLAILATEYVWARRYLNRLKQGGEKLTAVFFRRKKPAEEEKLK